MNLKSSRGMTLLELTLAMSMLGVVMVGGAAMNNSASIISMINQSDTKSRSDIMQSLMVIEQDLREFVKNHPLYSIEVGSANTSFTSAYVRLTDTSSQSPNRDHIQYSYSRTEKNLYKHTLVNGVNTQTPIKMPNFTTLLPFAIMGKDYNGDVHITPENEMILQCSSTKNPVHSPDCQNLKIPWVFDKSVYGKIVYVSFRIYNEVPGSNKPVVSKGYTKTIYLPTSLDV